MTTDNDTGDEQVIEDDDFEVWEKDQIAKDNEKELEDDRDEDESEDNLFDPFNGYDDGGESDID